MDSVLHAKIAVQSKSIILRSLVAGEHTENESRTCNAVLTEHLYSCNAALIATLAVFANFVANSGRPNFYWCTSWVNNLRLRCSYSSELASAWTSSCEIFLPLWNYWRCVFLMRLLTFYISFTCCNAPPPLFTACTRLILNVDNDDDNVLWCLQVLVERLYLSNRSARQTFWHLTYRRWSCQPPAFTGIDEWRVLHFIFSLNSAHCNHGTTCAVHFCSALHCVSKNVLTFKS